MYKKKNIFAVEIHKNRIMEKATQIKELLNVVFSEALEDESLIYYIDTLKIRSSDVVSQIEKLKDDCRFSNNSTNSHLLLGHRGCGKSTELNKLIKELEEENYPVHKINCIEEIDIHNIDKNDILFLISDSLMKIAKKVNAKIPDSLSKRIYDFLDTKEIITEKIKEKEAGVSAGIEANTGILQNLLNLYISLKGDIKYGTSKREIIRKEIQNGISDWLVNIKELKDIIYNKEQKLPILIFEDIDKISKPTEAITIFNNSIFANLQFPVVFTFPISVAFSSEFMPLKNQYTVHFLPMIKTHTKNNQDFADGINIIKDIIYARAEKNIFEDEAITLLITKTGGCLRDVFECINKAAFRAYIGRNSNIVEKEDIERALLELKSDYTRMLVVDDYKKLHEIYQTKRDIEDKDTCKMLDYLKSQVVLEYNGEGWFDVHPLVYDFVDERLKARSNG